MDSSQSSQVIFSNVRQIVEVLANKTQNSV